MRRVALTVLATALLSGNLEAAQPRLADFILDAAKTKQQLASQDPAVRRTAMHQFVGSLDTSAVTEYNDSLLPVLLSSMGDKDAEVRYYGFSAGRMLAHAVILSKQSKDGRFFGRNVSIDFRHEPKLDEVVRAATADPDPKIRVCAVSILGKAYPGAKQTEQLLIKIAKNEGSPKVRREIVDAIGAGNYKSTEAGDLLVRMLDDKAEDVRGWSAFFLGRAGHKAALTRIVKLLDDEKPFVQQRTLEGLAALGTDARPALIDLREKASKEKNAGMKRAFEQSIKAIEQGADKK